MDPNPAPFNPTNRTAVISAIAGMLTLLSFCIAVAPVPFTGYVCYPGAAVLGVVALVTGVASLAQIRTTAENGRVYAWLGISIGVVAVVATACAVTLGILFLPKILTLIHLYWK